MNFFKKLKKRFVKQSKIIKLSTNPPENPSDFLSPLIRGAVHNDFILVA